MSGTRLTTGTGFTNWAGNVRVEPARVHHPRSEDEVSQIVARAPSVRAIGAAHSCSEIATTRGDAIVLDRMTRVLSVERRTVTVEAGITLEALARALDENHQLALATLPAIGAPTIAGAIATGTHGSGMDVTGLAELVTGMRVVLASGDVIDIAEQDSNSNSNLDAFRTSLGALGIVTRVTLRCEDAFDVELHEEPGTFRDALDLIDKGTPTAFFWFPHIDRVSLRRFERRKAGASSPSPSSWWNEIVLGNRLHEVLRYASKDTASINRLWFHAAFGRARRAVGPSYEILTSTILVRQRVLEYAVPLERARAALEAVHAITNVHEAQAPIDVRFGCAERAWLGLAHARPTCWIGLIAFRPFGRETHWEGFFRRADTVLRGFDGRPHWGKIHWQRGRSLRALYPRWDEFLSLREKLDPNRKLVNEHLVELLER